MLEYLFLCANTILPNIGEYLKGFVINNNYYYLKVNNYKC